jgi:hypothetical protein
MAALAPFLRLVAIGPVPVKQIPQGSSPILHVSISPAGKKGSVNDIGIL